MAHLGPGVLHCLSFPRALAQTCLSWGLLPHRSLCWELMQKWRWEFIGIDAKVGECLIFEAVTGGF